MTVVVNGRFLPQLQGGLQRTARSMLTELRKLDDVEVVAPAPDRLADTVLRGPGGRAGGQLWEQVLLPRYAHGRTVLSLANTAPLAGRNVVWVHDLAPLVGPHWFRSSMRLYGRLVLRAAKRADLVVTVSDAVRGELLARGVPRVEVVRPAVDPSFLPSAGPAPIDGPYVLMVGWADPRKGLATALAAHRLVREPHRLVLVGGRRGVFAPVDPPTDPSVTVLPHVSDDDLRALLTHAKALLFPSRYEGFGLPPLEAAACGTRAVVSDLPVLRESALPTTAFVRAGDVPGWASAISAALAAGPIAPVAPTRTWSAAAAELAALLSDR